MGEPSREFLILPEIDDVDSSIDRTGEKGVVVRKTDVTPPIRLKKQTLFSAVTAHSIFASRLAPLLCNENSIATLSSPSSQ